jgi:hypothetical protein
VVERVADAAADDVVGGQGAPVQQQVVEVEHPERPLARPVGAEQRREVVGVLGAPWEVLVEHLAERALRVDRARVDVGERVLAREPGARRGVPVLLADEVEHVRGIAGVEQREAGGEAERRGMRPDDPVGDRVERPTDDAPRGR